MEWILDLGLLQDELHNRFCFIFYLFIKSLLVQKWPLTNVQHLQHNLLIQHNKSTTSYFYKTNTSVTMYGGICTANGLTILQSLKHGIYKLNNNTLYTSSKHFIKYLKTCRICPMGNFISVKSCLGYCFLKEPHFLWLRSLQDLNKINK